MIKHTGSVKVGLVRPQSRRVSSREKRKVAMSGQVRKLLVKAPINTPALADCGKYAAGTYTRKRQGYRKKVPVVSFSSKGEGNDQQEASELEGLVLEVVTSPVASASRWLEELPQEKAVGMRQHVKNILEAEGTEGRNSFLYLQKILAARNDLKQADLVKAHRTVLQILATVHTGILVYLHDELDMSSVCLSQIILQKRCRNVACLTDLPAERCGCQRCKSPGFCNLCMCIVCSKFDFDSNTCRWIGCDYCCHWCHTECALKGKMIRPWGAEKGQGKGRQHQEFRCSACEQNSELYGFVKDVFEVCAPTWKIDVARIELDYVCRMFDKSLERRGQQLHRRASQLLAELNLGGKLENILAKLSSLFDDLDTDLESPSSDGKSELPVQRKTENEERSTKKGTPIIPDVQASWRLSDVLCDAFLVVQADAEAKSNDLKRARTHYEACANEVETQTREAQVLEEERKSKRRQVEQLKRIVKLKLSEADMFQLRAEAARCEAKELETIASTKSERVEAEYCAKLAKLKFDEARAKREALCDIIQGIEQEVEQAVKNREKVLPEAIRLGVWPLPSRDNLPSCSSRPST